MAAGISIEESVRRFKSRGGTRTKQLIAVLKDLGVHTKTDHLVRWNGKDRPPDYAILKLRWPGRKSGHWVLNWKGIVYDPEMENPGVYCGGNGSHFTSYLEILPPTAG